MCPFERSESRWEDICVDGEDDEGRSGVKRRWCWEKDGIGTGLYPLSNFSISGFVRRCLLLELFLGVYYNRVVLKCLLLELYLNAYN
jgi:hypothetical protein